MRKVEQSGEECRAKWSRADESGAELKLLRFCAFLASRACGIELHRLRDSFSAFAELPELMFSHSPRRLVLVSRFEHLRGVDQRGAYWSDALYHRFAQVEESFFLERRHGTELMISSVTYMFVFNERPVMDLHAVTTGSFLYDWIFQ